MTNKEWLATLDDEVLWKECWGGQMTFLLGLILGLILGILVGAIIQTLD